MTSRRTFTKLLGLAGAALAAHPLQATVDAESTAISYMDGYHGGVIGHMPPGSWRDILSALNEFPDWKISLDIEPDSWAVLRREDPESFARLGLLLAEGSRVEMVGGTFAQPYGWAVSGESNIRQLQEGLRVIRESFPGLPVVTYAVQEPCWASCLPQILRSLGFTGASLKNASTAWGGYTAGYDADVVQWVGPDGSAIPAVPRYAMERLRFVYETESIDATEDFVRRCHRAGIEYPAGMCFQDLGWPAKPRVRRPGVQYRTWREYFSAVPKPATKRWQFTPEDILVTLPWGDATLRRVAQQVRSAENRMVAAEKMASMAAILQHFSYPAERLSQAWRQLLLSQAHDAWITATTRSGRQAWAFAVAQNTLDAETVAQDVIERSKDTFAANSLALQASSAKQRVLLFNTLATARDEVVEISIASDPMTTGFILRNEQGQILTTQAVVDRRFYTVPQLTAMSEQHEIAPGSGTSEDGGINHTVLLAHAAVPAFGLSCLTVEPLVGKASSAAGPGIRISEEADGRLLLHSDLYDLVLDSKHGGTLTSLVSSGDGTEFVHAGDRRFGEYRGYFIEEKAWHSSVDHAARITLRERGPLRAVVQIDSKIGPGTVSTLLTLIQGEPRLDFTVTLNFPDPVFIGDPYEVAPKEHRTQGRRSQNDGRWKLQVHFPFAPTGELYKSAAFDVCKSRVEDTSFQSWDGIKHNILAQWIDLLQPATNHGLAVMCDGTTAYNYGPGQSLGLVLAWAWEGGFWWGKHAIEGQHTIQFALLPHRSRWPEAKLWHEYSRFCEPILTALSSSSQTHLHPAVSLVSTSDPALQLSSMQMVEGSLYLRFFNAQDVAGQHHVRLGFRVRRMDLVDLKGERLHRIETSATEASGESFHLELPPFGLATIRCELG